MNSKPHKYDIVKEFPEFSKLLKSGYSVSDKRVQHAKNERDVLEYTLSTGERFYLKSFQSNREIAVLLSAIETALYDLVEVHDNYFIEKAIEPPFINISHLVETEKLNPEEVGMVYAKTLNELHNEMILYNAPFTESHNPEGEDHLFVNPKNMKIRVTDFGESRIEDGSKKADILNALDDFCYFYTTPEDVGKAVESFKRNFKRREDFESAIKSYKKFLQNLNPNNVLMQYISSQR